MSAMGSKPIDEEAESAPTSGRIFFLDLGAGRILSANPDGSDLKTIVNEGRKLPDGLVLDVAAGHIYWTNMGDPRRNDGSIMRSDLNGKNMITIVPPGGTFTPKQLQMEKRSGKLYWSDREGMRVMRANLDGSEIETLVDTSTGRFPLFGMETLRDVSGRTLFRFSLSQNRMEARRQRACIARQIALKPKCVPR